MGAFFRIYNRMNFCIDLPSLSLGCSRWQQWRGNYSDAFKNSSICWPLGWLWHDWIWRHSLSWLACIIFFQVAANFTSAYKLCVSTVIAIPSKNDGINLLNFYWNSFCHLPYGSRVMQGRKENPVYRALLFLLHTLYINFSFLLALLWEARSQYSILLCFLVFIRCGTVPDTCYIFFCWLFQIRQNKQEGYSKWIFYLVDSWLWSWWEFCSPPPPIFFRMAPSDYPSCSIFKDDTIF